jgi:hypothetical protein
MRNNIFGFTIKAVAIFLIVTILCSGFSLVTPAPQSTFLAAISDKHQILETTPGSRIIIVGGSGAAFGVDSEFLSKNLNRPVINDSYIIFIGLTFMLNDLAPYLHAGDTVVIVPEYNFFAGNPLYGEMLDGDYTLSSLIELNPALIRSFDLSQKLRIPDLVVYMLRNKLIRELSSMGGVTDSKEYSYVFNRYSFNQYGDFVSHLDKALSGEFVGLNMPYINENAEFNRKAPQVINQFAEQAQTSGAKVYLVFPAVMQSSCSLTQTQFQNIYKFLTTNLKILILSRPEDSCYPDTYFFDTYYHLNRAGRQLRALELVKLLGFIDK